MATGSSKPKSLAGRIVQNVAIIKNASNHWAMILVKNDSFQELVNI